MLIPTVVIVGLLQDADVHTLFSLPFVVITTVHDFELDALSVAVYVYVPVFF